MSERELVKGSAGLLVLSLLRRRPMYGYEIIQELRRRSEGVFELREGSLYPILHRLEADGSLEAYWEKAATGKRRKYYRLTSVGEAAFAERTDQWRSYQAAMLQVLEGKA